MINSLLYNLIFVLVFILYLPIFIIKLIHRGVALNSFAERFGLFRKKKKDILAALKDPVWIHAVSVGEVVTALNFMRRWQERDRCACFVLSTSTTTGHAIAKSKIPDSAVLIYSPLDFLWSVQSSLRVIRPSLLVIFEVEIWPNFIQQTKKSGARLALVNARMSDNSTRGYSRYKWFFKPLFNSFDVICAQSETDVQRLGKITDNETKPLLCNNMKFDQKPPLVIDKKIISNLVNEVFGMHSFIICAASTHHGEEEMMLEIFQNLQTQFDGLKLVLTPRHSERCSEIEKIIDQFSLSYSKSKTTKRKTGVDVLLVNTTGELINYMAVSDIVYVGKSMCGNTGGHNIIEPALLGKVVIHGPNMQNFKRVATIFQNEKASVMINNKEEFIAILKRLLADDSLRKGYSLKAKEVVKTYRGAIDKTLDSILQI